MNALVEAIERQPVRAFAVFAVLHLVLWTALPTALYPNLPLDVIEAHVYGREWQLGYDKLPPLPWWLIEIVHQTVGRDFGIYALAQVAVLAAFVLIFAMGRRLVGGVGALVAVALLDGLHYVHYTSAKFNHDVVQLPFWALAGVSFWAALRTGRILWWIALGFGVGMALWAKYFVIALALPLGLFMLAEPAGRRALRTPGPYVAGLVALLVALPHLVWLVQSDFLPFRFYVDGRAAAPRGWIDYVWRPLQFAVGQLGFLVPVAVLSVPLLVPRAMPPAAQAADDTDRRIVAWLAFGPIAACLAMALLTGRQTVAMWGYPIWLFLGLWIVLTVRAPMGPIRLKRFATLWAIVFFGFAAAFGIGYGIMPSYDGRYRAAFFPGDRLGQEIATRFRVLTGRPLEYVIATMWVGGNVSHYAPGRPRVLVDGRPARAPWIDLGDLAAKGAAVVWTDSDPRVLPPMFRSVAGDAEIQEPFALPYHRGKGEAVFGWAVLRPRPVVAGR